MSSDVRIRLRRPWGWAAALFVLHAGTIALLWAGGVPSPLAAALTVLVAAHAVHAIRRWLLLLDESPLVLELVEVLVDLREVLGQPRVPRSEALARAGGVARAARRISPVGD